MIMKIGLYENAFKIEMHSSNKCYSQKNVRGKYKMLYWTTRQGRSQGGDFEIIFPPRKF